MIKTVKDLSDHEINDQCIKYSINVDDLRRADKIRALNAQGVKSVYIPHGYKPLKPNQVNVDTQTVVRQSSQHSAIHNVVFAKVDEPEGTIELCKDFEEPRKILTNNVVVTDAVYSHLAVQNDLHINGSIISRGRVLNPEPVCIKVKSADTVNIDLKSDFYKIEAEDTVSTFSVNVSKNDLDECVIGHKGTMVFKGKVGTKVKFNQTDNNFSLHNTQTIPESGQFSFAFYVNESTVFNNNPSKHISVLFIEETPEANNEIFKTYSLSQLKDFSDDDDANVPPDGNAYLVSHKPDTETDPIISWQSVDYYNVDMSTTSSGDIITLLDDYINFDYTVDGNVTLRGFTTMESAIGKNGFINIKASSGSGITISSGTMWKFPESLPQLNENESLLIEYVVVKETLIVGKIVKQQSSTSVFNVPPYPDEIIVHVTVNSDGVFNLQKLEDNGILTPLTTLDRGATYLFVYQDHSFNQHPLRISDTPNGYWPSLA